MKVITIVGARPQFIKAAALNGILRTHPVFKEHLLHTGQHYDREMSEVFFAELDLQPPAWNLGVGSGSHGEQTGTMLIAIERLLLAERPGFVLVYGDTNSTLAGALAAAKLHIPVVHVEAGLRSHNFKMPEEINRRLTDHISELLFAPTEAAVHHLRAEGIPDAKIHQSGDVMYDVALRVARKGSELSLLRDLRIEEKKFVLATIHRAENTDDPRRLKSILELIGRISVDFDIVFPIHPRTRKHLETQLSGLPSTDRIRLIPPVGYLAMTELERSASIVLTDSGGVQKEAYFHRTPCMTLRDETEWVELVETGWNVLAPPGDSEHMHEIFQTALKRGPGKDIQLYGGGDSARQIISVLEKRFLN